jgi:hypothetical protein
MLLFEFLKIAEDDLKRPPGADSQPRPITPMPDARRPPSTNNPNDSEGGPSWGEQPQPMAKKPSGRTHTPAGEAEPIRGVNPKGWGLGLPSILDESGEEINFLKKKKPPAPTQPPTQTKRSSGVHAYYEHYENLMNHLYR